MENTAQLIWVSLQAVRDERERRTIELLAHWKPLVVGAERVLELPPLADGDLVVLSAPEINLKVERLIDELRYRTGGVRVMIRTRLGAGQPEATRGCGDVMFLDWDEGPELAKARVTMALAKSPHALSIVRGANLAGPVPEWRKRLVGQSHAIQKVAEVIRLVGPRRCTVLITGETGTG